MSRDTEEVKNVEEGNILSETSGNRIFVLQCAHCKTLLGDTGSLVSAQVEQSAIVLSKAVNIQVETSNFEVSNSGIDSGSAFHLVKCSCCSTVIGRRYKATPRSLDHIRDMYTLFESNLLSYPLSCSVETSSTETPKYDNPSQTLHEVTNDMRAVSSVPFSSKPPFNAMADATNVGDPGRSNLTIGVETFENECFVNKFCGS